MANGGSRRFTSDDSDGLIRLDASKGLKPTRRWRFDLYLEIR